MNIQNSFQVNGENIPFYHFYYEKEFSEVIRNKKISRKNSYYFKDGKYLPQFLAEETTKQFDFDSDYVAFEKAMFITIHAFSDFYTPRDLDNFNYKPFIDVIRKLKIVKDDTWKEVNTAHFGIYEEKESVDLYVVPFQYTLPFLQYELNGLFEGSYKMIPISEMEKREKQENGFFEIPEHIEL